MTASAQAGLDPLFATARLDGLRRGLLVLVCALFPVSKVVNNGGKLMNLALADLLLPLALLLLLWRSMSSGFRWPSAVAFLLNVGVLSATALWNLQLTADYKSPLGALVEIAKSLSLWVYFYLAVNFIEDARDLRWALRAWVGSSAVVAALGVGGSLLYQWAGVETVFSLQFRAQGTFEDSNLFAAHIGVSFFLTLLYWQLQGRRERWLWWVMPLQLAAVFLSASRGSLMAVGAALAALAFFFSSTRVKWAVGISLLMSGLLVMSLPNRDEWLNSNPVTARLTTTTVDLDNPEAQQRRELWNVAWRTWQANPWLGVGRGNYGLGQGGEAQAIGFAHNTYLGLLAETGILGFMTYAMVVLAMAVPALLVANQQGHGQASLLLAGLVVIALAGVTINIENYRGLWMLLALMEAYRRVCVGPLLPERILALRRRTSEVRHAHVA
ncbi:MAG: O-antigen ligase family protein [Bryobacteraceae bacterium]|nr:O-antigen ligase family protein [Bryobacteraceae bacterium]